MRIAFIASIVDGVLSGLGVYTVNLLRALARLHDDLRVYTSAPAVCGVNPGIVRRVGPGVQPWRGRRGHLQRIAWIQTSLALRLVAERASVLLSPVPEGMLIPLVPQVVVVHDLTPLHFPHAWPRQSIYFRHVLPLVLERCRAVIADSESTRRDLISQYSIDATRIHVVPCGYARDRYRAGIDASSVKQKYELGPYLLYVGNLLPHKNLPRLLEAFAMAADAIPHTLIIAGRKDPRYHPTLETCVQALNLRDRVRFLDYVTSEDLPALYAGADIVLLPSLYEGFGLPVLEAMACGTPVIASRAGSLPEATGGAAFLIDPVDTRALAGAINLVVDDPPTRAAMRSAGLEQVSRFSWERTAEAILDCVKDVRS